MNWSRKSPAFAPNGPRPELSGNFSAPADKLGRGGEDVLNGVDKLVEDSLAAMQMRTQGDQINSWVFQVGLLG